MNKIGILVILLLSQTNTFGQLGDLKFGFFETYIDNQWIISSEGIPPTNLNEAADFDWVVISNVRYPDLARRMGIEGNVLMEIIIDKNGQTKSQLIKHHIGADTDKELKRLIPKLPMTWAPATINGEKVDSRILILFRFTLFDIDKIETSDKIYKCFKIRSLTTNSTSVTKADHLIVYKEKEEKSKKKKSKD